jgi:murein DD-endopeptidase MepM/ murein hydrolase activator NlpD
MIAPRRVLETSLALAAGLGAMPAGAAARPAVTPVIAQLVPQKAIVPVRGSDGRYHVMYELQLTNTASQAARLRSVAALRPNRKRIRAFGPRFMTAGDGLHKPDRSSVKTTRIPPNQMRVLFVNLAFRSRGTIPGRVVHRLRYRGFDAFTNRTRSFAYVTRSVPLRKRRRPPVLGAPLGGPGWLASDGCCSPTGHVSALFGLGGQLQAAERYAIDWFGISADGRVYHGDPTVLRNWVGYGARLKAAASGVVTAVHDGRPDQTPLAKPPALEFSQLPGNDVVIRLRSGVSLVYAHLIPGSPTVHVGQHVRRGQVIGCLGNSGGSLAPHLHFHVVNGPHGALSDGFPFVQRSFARTGKTNVQTLLKVLQGEGTFPRRDQLHPVAHHRELPLGFTINDFPGTR